MFKEFDQEFKIVIVGNTGVGKSAILLRFVDDTFKSDTLTTIGVDFRFKSFYIQGKKVKLQIWDTAGQQTFRTIVGAYYNKADGIILVFDLTQSKSFQELQSFWLKEVQKNKADNSVLMMLGNKCDLQNIQVTQQQISSLKKQHQIPLYFETSAKTSDDIEKAFQKMTQLLIEQYKKAPRKQPAIKLEDSIIEQKVEQKPQKTKKKCCLQ